MGFKFRKPKEEEAIVEQQIAKEAEKVVDKKVETKVEAVVDTSCAAIESIIMPETEGLDKEVEKSYTIGSTVVESIKI